MNTAEMLQSLIDNGIIRQVNDEFGISYKYKYPCNTWKRVMYRDTPISSLRIDSYTRVLTNYELILTKPAGVTSQVNSYDISMFIDGLYYKHNQPEFRFQNGKLRKAFISNTIARARGEKANWSETQRRLAILTRLWAELETSHKDQLIAAGTHTTTGDPLYNLIAVRVLEGDGKVTLSRVNTAQYFRSSLLYNYTGETVWIPIDGNETKELITIGSSAQQEVSPFEKAWIARTHTQCSECGTWENKDYLVFGLCRSCTRNAPVELSTYSTRAPDVLGSITRKGKFSEYFTGIELEYELTGKNSKKETLFLLHRSLGEHAIFKRDGSLNNGVEICTRPACINTHEEYFAKFWADQVLQDNLEDASTCGMHVHIDKRSMSALTLGKLVQFMQSKANVDFLKKIAGRSSNRYATTGTDHKATSVLDRSIMGSRYQAINLQNSNTAEIRIFKSPASYEEFMKNMEFIDAIRSYVLPANSGVTQQRWEDFASFVIKSKKTHPTLYKFLQEKF